MVQQPEPKTAVALIRGMFADKGVNVQTKEAYELLAQLWGYKNWATYRGMNPKTKAEPTTTPQSVSFGRQSEELAGWHTWIVAGRWGDDGEELFLLPPGATLENRYGARNSWRMVDDEDAVPFSVGFTDPAIARESWQDVVVLEEVACQYPRSDRYGFPMYANEREIGKWAEEELGWGYLSTKEGMPLVEVNGDDHGDDSPGCWWAQVLVHPTVHERLLTQFEPRNIAFDVVWPRIVLDEPYTSRAGDSDYDIRVVHLRKSAGQVFADLDSLTLKDVMDALRYSEESTDAEAALRSELKNDLITVQGIYSGMTAGTLRERMEAFIASAASTH